MSKYYSVLEQHNDGTWWHHMGYTFNSREEAEEKVKDFNDVFPNRPTWIYEHNIEMPQNESLAYMGNGKFGFGGLIKCKVK